MMLLPIYGDSALPVPDVIPLGLLLLRGAIGVQFGQVLKQVGCLSQKSDLE
ncbi:MAG: hypothetical protein KME27_00375 [Lyngbya sp. HA4199-MV5]|jgi:hypothetical protein|nr:hypothetical protein [Lyngbya sp. HA4199-MV5]